MKVKLPEEMLSEIRHAIRACQDVLVDNRKSRRQLILEIRAYKANIKAGENLCSKLEDGAVVDVGYIRADLQKKRQALADLRVRLVSAEVHYALERARCITLHDQLDRFNEPYDPTVIKKAK